MKDTLKIVSAVIAFFVALYLFFAFMEWILTDPFNLFADQEKCKYEIMGQFECATKEEYCRKETRFMFFDLNDTWGSNTNNQDAMSKTMLEVYNKCLETE